MTCKSAFASFLDPGFRFVDTHVNFHVSIATNRYIDTNINNDTNTNTSTDILRVIVLVMVKASAIALVLILIIVVAIAVVMVVVLAVLIRHSELAKKTPKVSATH